MKKKNIIIPILIAVLALIIAACLLCYLCITLPKEKEHEELLKAAEEYYNSKLESYEKENEKYADFEVDAVFLGDSLTDGYDLEKYYPEYTVLNRGIAGDTTFGLEERLKVSVFDVYPKVAVMLIGGNNLGTMFENYESILQEFKEKIPKTKIILVSLTSMGGDGWGEKNELAAYNNVKIKLFAEKYGYEFVDLYTPLFDLETGEIKAEYTTDGAHQTPTGYEVFTENIKPVLQDLLEN